MGDEVATFTFKFEGEDQFTAAMARMGAAADAMVAKVNSAFANIKPVEQITPQIERLKQKAGEAGSAFDALGAKIGGAFRGLSGVLGEPARLLGELAEKTSGAASAIAGGASGIVGAFTAMGTAAAAAMAAVGIAKWGGDQVEALNQLRASLNVTAAGFAQIRALGHDLALPLSTLAPVIRTINEGWHQAAVSFDQQAERMKFYEDRIALAGQGRDNLTDKEKKAREELQQQAEGERSLLRLHREQRQLLEGGPPVERIAANYAKLVQGADLSSESLEKLRDEAEKINELPPEIRFFKSFEQLQAILKVSPEQGSRLFNALTSDAAKFGERLPELVAKGKELEEQYNKLGKAGYERAIELKDTGADKMAADLTKVVDAWNLMTAAAGKAGIAIAAALGPAAVGILDVITTVIDALKDVVKAADSAAVSLAKVVASHTPEAVTRVLPAAVGAALASQVPILGGLFPTLGQEGGQTPAIVDRTPSGVPRDPAAAMKAAYEANRQAYDQEAAEQRRKTGEPEPVRAAAPAGNAAAALANVPAPANATAESLASVSKAAADLATRLNSISAPGGGEHKAGGGLINGPGTGTSDSIPISASRGEYVIRADGGNLGAAIAHFAEGGLVRFQDGGLVVSGSKEEAERDKQADALAREENELGWETYLTNLQRKIAALKKELQELQEKEKGGQGIGVSVPSKVETNKYGVRTRVYFNADGTPRAFVTLSGGGDGGGGGDKKSRAVKELEAQIKELEDQMEKAQNSKKDQEMAAKGKELDERELALRGFHASGGMIHGPGGPTSDSVPIMASHGEYVVRAAAVSHLGRSFMDRINAAPGFAIGGLADAFSLNMPRFQAGGMVGGPAAAQALHPVHLHLPNGETVSGLHGTPDAVAQLSRHAILQQGSSTGRRPSWDR